MANNKNGLTDRRRVRAELRGRLLARRHKLLAQMRVAESVSHGHAQRSPMDEIEQSIESSNEEIALRIQELRSQKVRQVEDALDQIPKGTYGKCTACGCRISAVRLELLPEATICVACQKELERDRTAEDVAADWERVAEGGADEPRWVPAVRGVVGRKL